MCSGPQKAQRTLRGGFKETGPSRPTSHSVSKTPTGGVLMGYCGRRVLTGQQARHIAPVIRYLHARNGPYHPFVDQVWLRSKHHPSVSLPRIETEGTRRRESARHPGKERHSWQPAQQR